MAQQTINIGTTANDGTGDPLRIAFDKVNDNFTELYSDDAADVNSVSGGQSISVDTSTGDVTVSVTDGSIDFTQLDDRFSGLATNGAAAGSLALDFSHNFTFELTLTGDTTLSFSNAVRGDVKNLVVTGAYTLTLPSGTLTNGVAYDGTQTNFIQVVVSNTGYYYYSISQGTTVTLV